MQYEIVYTIRKTSAAEIMVDILFLLTSLERIIIIIVDSTNWFYSEVYLLISKTPVCFP